jgi:uncharacterized protein (DUF927 family)
MTFAEIQAALKPKTEQEQAENWRKSANENPIFDMCHMGSEDFHLVSRMYPNYIITDGVKKLAETYQCYWLLTDFVFCMNSLKPKVKQEEFQVWELSRNVKGQDAFTVRCHDGDKGNGEVTLFKQVVPYSDFQDDYLRLFFERSNKHMVLMLPCER